MDEAEVGRIVGEVTVTYTLRELLSRIDARVIELNTKFETVATTAQVQALETKVDGLEQKVDGLESHRDRVLGFAIGLSLAAGGGAGWVANLLAAR